MYLCIYPVISLTNQSIRATVGASRTSCALCLRLMARLAYCVCTGPSRISISLSVSHCTAEGRHSTNLFIAGKFEIEDQPLRVVEFGQVRVRSLLTALDAQHNLAHYFEFLPVDPGLVLADECLIAFFGGDQVAAVEWEEWDSWGEGVVPGESVCRVAFLRSHEDDQPEERFFGMWWDQCSRLG